MLVNILSLQFLLYAWQINGAVWNHVNKDCSTCYCPATKRPVCTIIKENKKAPPTYKTFHNDCEYVCYAACNEEKVKFVYCGECDNRTLTARGSKGVPEEMVPCLNFTIIPGPGIGGPPPETNRQEHGTTESIGKPVVTVTLDPIKSVLPEGSIVLGYKEKSQNDLTEEESCSKER